MNLNEWAIKWGIPYAALEDLRRGFGLINTDPTLRTGASEAAIQTQVRLEASTVGARIWRNNNGALYDQEGNFMRFGLANDSAQMNKVVKSSDLIGLRPVTITPEHVGRVIGQFMAREIKPANWRYSGNERELAQLAFLELVAALGGDACFAIGKGTIAC